MLTLRNVRQDDAELRERVIAFLRDNPDEGVRLRPDAMLDHAFQSGLALVVEREGELVATRWGCVHGRLHRS